MVLNIVRSATTPLMCRNDYKLVDTAALCILSSLDSSKACSMYVQPVAPLCSSDSDAVTQLQQLQVQCTSITFH